MSFEDIIDKVKTRPEIWQRAHPLYKNKMLRLKIWNTISKELDTDATQLKKSWKYLNDQFRREYKKMKSLALYEGKPIPCGWAYYERLAFLKNEMAMRRDRQPARIPVSSDSDTAANDTTMTHESFPTATHESFPTVTQESFPTMTHESFQQEDESNDQYENVTWKYNMTNQHTKQAKPGTSGISKADLILRRLQNLSATVSRSQSEMYKKDEDYMFFMSILPMVRSLSPVRKLQLRGKINEWLLQTLAGEADPLTNAGQYVVPVDENCEDNKEAVMKQIMQAEDDD